MRTENMKANLTWQIKYNYTCCFQLLHRG